MRSSARKRRRPRRIILTDRDKRILCVVERFRLVTREQFQKFVGWECTSKINTRLRMLYDSQLLDRRFLPVRYGMAPAIYLLGSEGVAEVARITGADAGLLNKNRCEDRSSADTLLSHKIALNDFASLMYANFRNYGDAEWQEWLNERDLIQRCNVPGAIEGADLKPDGFVQYRIGKYRFNAFIELDTGSESSVRLQRKLDTYWEFKDTGRYTETFHQKGFRVIIVTLSLKRAINLAAKLHSPGDLVVYIGALPGLSTDMLFGAHWYQTGSDRVVALHSKSILVEGATP